MSNNYYIGVDVGTGSVRAALIRSTGEIIRTSESPIKIWNPQPDFYEQSSDDIWESCVNVIKEVSKSIDPNFIKGIGFDATCSLVCIGENNQPLTVSLTGKHEQNVILWMDHRATSEADFIIKHKPNVLKYVGGKISPEMQTPKLMWLKKNLINTWEQAKYFFDLVDFLTWKATGDDSRSLCTLVCKWTYVEERDLHVGWDKSYFSLINLEDLLENNSNKIGSNVKVPGEKCGSGLTNAIADELQLLPGTCVSVGVIDAHAGGLGMLASSAPGINPSMDATIGLICGTSTCHMVVSDLPKFIPGIWGPYFSAMVPGMYLNEAGQSATGKLIDFVIENHSAFSKIMAKLSNRTQIYDYLNDVLARVANQRGVPVSRLTKELHVWPDFHGNRSPLADPSLLGMVSGLSLTANEENLAILYLATIQALAYGTKFILETLRAHGYNQISTALMCGGLSKNQLFVQTHADVLGLPVLCPKSSNSVLLGAGVLASVAAGEWKNIQEALKEMNDPSSVFSPLMDDKEYHSKKYKVFKKMVEDQKSYKTIMET